MPERKTIANLLMTAIKPLGSTRYVWGGGWNEENTGAGVEGVKKTVEQAVGSDILFSED